ncbi:MAG: hypothetical protein ACI9EF_002283 [Pseudohongiellaceae bacterium]|jgi:hypothetical protein
MRTPCLGTTLLWTLSALALGFLGAPLAAQSSRLPVILYRDAELAQDNGGWKTAGEAPILPSGRRTEVVLFLLPEEEPAPEMEVLSTFVEGLETDPLTGRYVFTPSQRAPTTIGFAVQLKDEQGAITTVSRFVTIESVPEEELLGSVSRPEPAMTVESITRRARLLSMAKGELRPTVIDGGETQAAADPSLQLGGSAKRSAQPKVWCKGVTGSYRCANGFTAPLTIPCWKSSLKCTAISLCTLMDSVGTNKCLDDQQSQFSYTKCKCSESWIEGL